VAVGDFNGDGKLDLAVANMGRYDQSTHEMTNSSVSVLLGKGDGTFQRAINYDEGTNQFSVAVGDFNNDGKLDLAIAHLGSPGSVSVLLGKGDGTFQAGATYAVGVPLVAITAGDFNRVGLIALAVPHRDGGQSRVYLAGPKGSFSAARTIPFGPPNATIRMAEAADFNGDGLLDIVAIDERAGTAIYFGQRNGSFSERVAVGDRTSTPYALAVGDLNGDGKPDIVVGNVEAPSAIYFNDGSGRAFHVVQFGDNKGTVYGFAIADLDRDGVADIAVARSEAPNVVYFGTRTKAKTP